MKIKLIVMFSAGLIVFIISGCFSNEITSQPSAETQQTAVAKPKAQTKKQQTIKPKTPAPKTIKPKTPAPTQNSTQVSQGTKEFILTAKQWSFSPSKITVNKGDKVILHIKSIDVTHGFELDAFEVSKTLSPGKTVDVQFVASKTGTFSFSCNVFCGSGHGDMEGTLIVK